ncbi:MAG: hypothetical protein AAFX95_01155 [Cyanobacteria bacterium J06639_16]
MQKHNPRSSADVDTAQVNPGYPLFQIAKALTTAEHHEDPATRERAQQRIVKWTAVLNGLLNGTVDVGSRSPLGGVPNWVTLEVVTGGFATGQLMAGGPLLEHELALLAELPGKSEADGRRALNGYFVTDEGLDRLQRLLQSGCYEVAIPEEGALLVVAWLVHQGYADQARELLAQLAPWFSRLRFYPIPTDRPCRLGSQVCLQTVGNTVASLKQIEPNPHILAQKEAVNVWAPLYDRTVSLFIETVEGDTPHLQYDREGCWVSSPDGKFPVEGGWPCRHYPGGWQARAKGLLNEYKQQRSRYTLCGKPERKKESFYQLRKFLRQILRDPQSLSGRDVGRIRLILARYVTKRGVPGSPQCSAVRERQAQQVKAPTFQEIAEIVIRRLAAYPLKDGLDDIRPVVQPVMDAEARQWRVEAGTSVARSLQRKVERCLRETVEVLVERGLITSGETLARVLPQITSEIRAAGVTEPTLRQLYASLYRAFRRRRSLLLLNLEKQIQIEELPWVAAIDRFRSDNLSARELARQTLKEIMRLTLTAFPHAILPNKLLQELRALSKTAMFDLPLVDEVAADIFMGTFSNKFLNAAKRAADFLEGTLYATYYGIDYQQVRAIPESQLAQRSWFRKTNHDPFMDLCESRAGVRYGSWDPAINGMIIEQQQILTSQNLAVLFSGLDLVDALEDQLADLAPRCFTWICKRLQMKTNDWHAQLIQVKNTAYAWRQMVFFLSLLSNQQIGDFLNWAEAYLAKQPAKFQNRFRPALRGLVLAAAGCSIEENAVNHLNAYRFTGWSKKRHWLLTDV